MNFVCHILKHKYAAWRQACEKMQNECFASYLSDAVFPLRISFIKYQLGCQHMVLLFEHGKYNTALGI